MFFRQLMIYTLESDTPDFEAMETQLAGKPFEPTRPQQVESIGWSQAFGALYLHETDQAGRMVLQREERSVPAAVVREQAEARLRERDGEMSNPSRQEQAAMRDAVLLDLLPQAFPKQSRSQIIIDRRNHRVWFDTVTGNRIERASNQLRELLGNWRMVPTLSDGDISGHLTQWLQHGPPAGFEIGASAKLVDPREGATVTVSRLALPDPHVLAHIEDGLRVEQLEMIWKDRLSFVLRQDGGLARIKPTELIDEQRDAGDDDNPDALLDADQRLMVGLFRELAADLETVLQRVETDKTA